MEYRPAISDENAEREYLLDRTRWLIDLRWLAVAGVFVATIAGRLTGFIQEPRNLAAVGAAIAAFNAFSHWRLRRTRSGVSLADARRPIFEQLLVDMVALGLLLHFSGGAENPFEMLFAFPAAVAAMLLPIRKAIAVGATGGLLHVAIVLGQFAGWLPHHGLHGAAAHHPAQIVDPLYRSPRFLAGYLLSFVTMLAGVIYLVGSVTARYRRAEALQREHERVAQSHEKLARIGELSAGVAHAVRNPLHGVMSTVGLLRTRMAGDAKVMEMLSLIAEALGRIEAMTRRMLSLTRDVPLQRVSCDVDALVADTIRVNAARGSGCVRTELGGAGTAQLDPARFAEAIDNLVDNALHACRDGGAVTVRTAVEDDAGDHVAIEVADTGQGIAAQDLDRLFHPFFTTKAVGEGTGLGLAITRRIVEEHGGRLALESAPGRGTRIRLVLPRCGTPGAGGSR